MLQIKPDIRITRRLYSHFVLDSSDLVLLQTPHLAECFDYLIDGGHREVHIVCDNASYRLTLSKEL